MRLKHLESALSSLPREFPDPKVNTHNHLTVDTRCLLLEMFLYILSQNAHVAFLKQVDLEQYPTSPSLTASVVLTALMNEDVGPGCSVLDLGCGTGMLLAGCVVVGTRIVMGVDCDEQALAQATENVESILEDYEGNDESVPAVEFLLARVASVGGKVNGKPKVGGRGGRHSGRGGRGRGNNNDRRSTPQARALIVSDDDGIPLQPNCVDTVLTNPPFGTKHNAGMDLRFLRTATRLARHAVYSFHKSSTREFLVKQVTSWGMEVQVVAQMRFDLPKVYKFHKEKSVDIEVDLIRVIVNPEAATL